MARRAHDARRKSAILMVYSVDVELRDETAVLARFKGDHHVRVTPDTDYRFVAKAPEGFGGPRPVVIDAGPCGPVRRPDPGADGAQADHRRPRQGRARTDQGYLGAVAQERAEPGVQRPVRRGRGRHLLGR
ncbi:hypothetical protein ACRAWD_15300 [Caulobacter segnis]